MSYSLQFTLQLTLTDRQFILSHHQRLGSTFTLLYYLQTTNSKILSRKKHLPTTTSCCKISNLFKIQSLTLMKPHSNIQHYKRALKTVYCKSPRNSKRNEIKSLILAVEEKKPFCSHSPLNISQKDYDSIEICTVANSQVFMWRPDFQKPYFLYYRLITSCYTEFMQSQTTLF